MRGRRTILRAISLGLIVAAAACGDRDAARPAPADHAGGTVVRLIVDGIPATPLAIPPKTWIPLTQLVRSDVPPMSAWVTVSALRPQRKLALGVETYQDAELVVYRDSAGVSLGLFPRALGGERSTRKPLRSLADIDEIQITTTTKEKASRVVATPTLQLIRAGRTTTVRDSDLRALPSSPWKARGNSDTPAWHLLDVIGLSGPPDHIASIELSAATGPASRLDASEIDARLILRAGKDGFNVKRIEADGTTSWRARDIVRISIVEQ